MDVSVIIVNYNTTQLTIDAINSLIKKTEGVIFEVILVDNNSEDRSIDNLQHLFPNIKYIRNSNNIGFGRANNVGARSAIGNYLFLLNSDTLLINNGLKILFDFMENNINVGISGGNLFDKAGNPIHSFMKYFRTPITEIIEKTFISKILKKYSIYNQFNYSNNPIEVAYITGADLLIRKKIFDNIKGFDPDFFMYFEDAELGNRVKKEGHKIMSVPNAKITHLVGASSSMEEEKLRIFLKSKYLYYRKVNNTFSASLVKFLDCVFAIFGYVYYSIIRNSKRSRTCIYYIKYIIKN